MPKGLNQIQHRGPDGRYQLLACVHPEPGAPSLGWRHIGRYGELEEAVQARVEDVLAQLAANDGWRIQTQHLIVGPGGYGPATLHCYISTVGADPADDQVPSPHNEPALRQWLLAAHALPA